MGDLIELNNAGEEVADPDYAHLKISSTLKLGSDEPDDLVEHFEVQILDEYEEEQIGEMSIYRMAPVFADKHGYTNFELWDSVSVNCANVGNFLDDYEDEIAEIVGTTIWDGNSFWYVESVEVKPEHRGHRLGYKSLQRFLQCYVSVNEMVIIEPAEIGGEKGQGREWLTRYWGGLGFKTVTDSNYMVANNNMMFYNLFGKFPGLDDIEADKNAN